MDIATQTETITTTTMTFIVKLTEDVKPSGLGRHRLKCPRYQLHQVAAKAQSALLDD